MSSRHHDLVGEAGKKLADIVKKAPTFVRYHMNGCGHCIAMEKEWDKLTKAGHKGIEFVNVEQSALSHIPEHLKEGVSGFPTLISYAKGGVDRIEHQGERTADAMGKWLKENGRIGGQSGGSRRRRHRRSRVSRKMRSGRRASRRAGMRRRAASRRRRAF